MIKPTENSSLTNVASFMEQPISAQEEQHLKMLNQQQGFSGLVKPLLKQDDFFTTVFYNTALGATTQKFNWLLIAVFIVIDLFIENMLSHLQQALIIGVLALLLILIIKPLCFWFVGYSPVFWKYAESLMYKKETPVDSKLSEEEMNQIKQMDSNYNLKSLLKFALAER